MTIRRTARRAGVVLLAAIGIGLGAPGGSSATSCSDRPGLIAGGLTYSSTGASPGGLRVGRARPARVGACDDSKALRTSAFAIADVDRRIAVAARTRDSRMFIFSRAGFFPQVPDHPLHAAVYRRRQPPAPEGCGRRSYRVIARLRSTPDFESLLDLSVRRAETGFRGTDDDEAVGAVTRNTEMTGLRRHGAAYIGAGTRLVLGMSNCELNQSVIRTVRRQRGRDLGPAVRLRAGDSAAWAPQFGKCTPRRATSRRGCPLFLPPENRYLKETLTLQPAAIVRVTFPFAARRASVSLIVTGAPDSYGVVSPPARVASPSGRQWEFRVPANALNKYDTLGISAETARGTSRVYYARIAVARAAPRLAAESVRGG